MKKFFNILTTLVMVVIIGFAGILIIPKFLGYHSFVVLTGSMEPTIHTGALAFVKPAQPSEVKDGDIITFFLQGDTVATHRALEVHEDTQSFKTKGDANDTADFAEIPFANLIGIFAFSVPLLGYISQFMQSKYGIIVVGALLLVLVLSIMLPLILKKDESKEEKQEPKEEN